METCFCNGRLESENEIFINIINYLCYLCTYIIRRNNNFYVTNDLTKLIFIEVCYFTLSSILLSLSMRYLNNFLVTYIDAWNQRQNLCI